jgi:hypothetical protein
MKKVIGLVCLLSFVQSVSAEEASEQILMIQGKTETNLQKKNLDVFEKEVDFRRFKIETEQDPNSSTIRDWCARVTKDVQFKRENNDATGESLDASVQEKIERCSKVYRIDHQSSTTCQVKTSDDGKSAVQCKMEASLSFTKYKYVIEGSTESYMADEAFGEAGVRQIKDDNTVSSAITEKTTRAEAEASARKSAAFITGLFMAKKMREIEDFQIRAPITNVTEDSATVSTCLGSRLVPLDMPFFIKYKDESGKEVEAGFVKARTIRDGCASTSYTDEKTAEGKEVELGPMEGQVILTDGNLRQGYTLVEMPTAGVNFGLDIGLLSAGDALSPAFGLNAEYSLAKWIGVSELYVSLGGDYVMSDDFDSGYQGSFGALKRLYIGGAFFLDAAVGLTYSAYSSKDESGTETKLSGAGAYAGAGAGFQFSPRILAMVNLGFRHVALAEESDTSAVAVAGSNEPDPESGLTIKTQLRYTY